MEVKYAPAVMRQHQKDVEDWEANRRHGEEIDGD